MFYIIAAEIKIALKTCIRSQSCTYVLYYYRNPLNQIFAIERSKMYVCDIFLNFYHA